MGRSHLLHGALSFSAAGNPTGSDLRGAKCPEDADEDGKQVFIPLAIESIDDPNGAACRTITCSRRAIGRGPMSARTPSTPELDQLRCHARKIWSDGCWRRPARYRQCGRWSIAGSGDKRCRTASILRPEIIPHMSRHHANRGRRYKQLLRGHMVHLRRRLKAQN